MVPRYRRVKRQGKAARLLIGDLLANLKAQLDKNEALTRLERGMGVIMGGSYRHFIYFIGLSLTKLMGRAEFAVEEYLVRFPEKYSQIKGRW